MADMKRRQFLLSSAAVLAVPTLARPSGAVEYPIIHLRDWVSIDPKPKYVGNYITSRYPIHTHMIGPPTISGTASEGEALVFTPGEWEAE